MGEMLSQDEIERLLSATPDDFKNTEDLIDQKKEEDLEIIKGNFWREFGDSLEFTDTGVRSKEEGRIEWAAEKLREKARELRDEADTLTPTSISWRLKLESAARIAGVADGITLNIPGDNGKLEIKSPDGQEIVIDFSERVNTEAYKELNKE